MAVVAWKGELKHIRPMLATLEDAPLQDPALVYEPKYDGIRGLVELGAGGRPPVQIWSRLGNDKTAQFPDLVAALNKFAARLKSPVILDGEIVALDEQGDPAGFQRLQNRIHLTESNSRSAAGRVAFIAFDILRDGKDDVRGLPLSERRARLERVFAKTGSPILRISELAAGDGQSMYSRALERGWEGLIAKGAASLYHTGKRTRDWRKLKLVHEQEFVVGGWTEARTTGRAFGALLLGHYEDGVLKYAGHSGGGFTGDELDRVMRLLKPLEIASSPFDIRPRTNERPHWTTPSLVAQVKFTEWTDEGLLRHPIYLGLRDDVRAETVKREKTRAAARPKDAGRATKKARRVVTSTPAQFDGLLQQLEQIERGPNSGTLKLPDGSTLEVSNLRKPFWPKLNLTKGDLMRYYVQVAPFILPVLQDRPLIMKRFPNGIDGQAFYQQRAPDTVPPGVRVAEVAGDKEVPARLIGGDLITLLYMTQLAAISQDPWFSRVQSPGNADWCAIDLDPMPGVKFAKVLDVARWVRDELAKLKVQGFPKTSGSSGLHIYVPLRKGTPYESGQIFCQIVATVVAEKHPKVATIARSVKARGQTVYVDYLQNIEGKSIACAYSARASDFAGASTPLTWSEVDAGVDPHEFTIKTLPERLKTKGDLWAPSLSAEGADLRRLLKK